MDKIESVWFDLQEKCNLRCPSCIDRSSRGNKKLTIEMAEKVLTHIVKHFNPNYIAIYNWAEPFLHKDIYDFVELISAYNVDLWISSNMSCDIADGLPEKIIPHVKDFRFSVSAIEQSVYSQYHQGGNLDKVFSNIERFIEAKKRTHANTNFKMIFGLNKYNKSQAEPLREYCNKHGIEFCPTRYYLPDGADAYKAYLNEYLEPSKYDVLYDSYEELHADVLARLCPNHCPILGKEICFDCDGNLMVCRSSNISLPIHITEVMTIKQLVEVTLQNDFCKRCLEIGLHEYFDQELSDADLQCIHPELYLNKTIKKSQEDTKRYKKYPKFLINLLCWFIPSKEKRKLIRNHHVR